jgi:hypothetical protein
MVMRGNETEEAVKIHHRSVLIPTMQDGLGYGGRTDNRMPNITLIGSWERWSEVGGTGGALTCLGMLFLSRASNWGHSQPVSTSCTAAGLSTSVK